MKKLLIAVCALILLLLAVPLAIVNMTGGTPPPAPDSAEPMAHITTYISALDKVEEIDFTEYIKGVIAAEMPASFHEEALKAQAVAARSYILARIGEYNREGDPPEHKGAMICTDPNHCKAYFTEAQLVERWGQDWLTNYWGKISAAAESTVGQVMAYDGQIVNAVFHSSSSGRTENSKDVWGGDVPYLVSVDSPGEEASPKHESHREMSIDAFKSTILTSYPDAVWTDDDEPLGDIIRSEAGGITSLTVGGKHITGGELRSMFSLNSTHVEFSFDNDNVTMSVIGSGHGVGMSQYGANHLAETGMGYEDILKKYYSGVELVDYKVIGK